MMISGWDVIYKRAYNDDGSLLFPERLSDDFLSEAKKTMGSYLFANQYLNEVFPSDDAKFKPEWFREYSCIPELTTTFAFIDPAISTEDGADYTAIVIIKCDCENNWYVVNATRARITPTQIVDKVFELYKIWKPNMIGIESVAYQKALIYMVSEETRKRNQIMPIQEVHPGTKQTKEMRILGLVPRFEWGKLFLSPGLDDLRNELLQFPRGTHDDLADALSAIEKIVYYPQKKKEVENVTNPHSANYERNVIKNLYKRANERLYD